LALAVAADEVPETPSLWFGKLTGIGDTRQSRQELSPVPLITQACRKHTMKRLIRRWLPPAHICHPYPSRRLRVTT
jgi:hypothetical protein